MSGRANPSPLQILVVDDDEDLLASITQHFQRAGAKVLQATSGEEALAKATESLDVALVDLHLPGMDGLELLARLKEARPEVEVIFLTAHSSVETAVKAMRQGAYDYLTKPFRLADLEAHAQKACEKARLARRERQWVEHLNYESPRYRLIGSGPAMRKVVAMIEKVAATDATVLIRGESGTGKELVARAIHLNSTRANRPMVTVNCAALPETLLESELFGHEKGSFTGAVTAKRGLVEVAEGGTLFIDEIGEMAAGLQAKLLRVLEDGHYRRVGSTSDGHADVRIVAATNRRLEDEIKANRFREDLYYRLNVITIYLPPLRDHPEDIPELVQHLLATRQVGGILHRITPQAMSLLTRYRWPGNVRELANVLERAQILCEGSLITPDDLPEDLTAPSQHGGPAASAPGAAPESAPRTLEGVERAHLMEVLRECGGNKVRAARALGVSRRALYRLLDRHGLREDATRLT
jgi:DNA-binding NtrC family response regulator